MSLESAELFAVAPPGLEGVVARELEKNRFRSVRRVMGGVTFAGDLTEAARANLWLRAASRVLLRVGAFDAPGRRELRARIVRFSWDALVAPGAPIHVQVTCHKSRLYHTGLVSEVVHEALGRPSAAKEAEAPTLHVRIVNDRCTLSIDTSGELLHRRGYRQEQSRAPLRETLAAGLLSLCGYGEDEPFTDPMCGSGTLAIEAALLAMRRAPGLQRPFAIEAFPSFDPAALVRLRDEARAGERTTLPSITGSDLHAGALAAARRNAERAGVESFIAFERVGVAAVQPKAETGLLVTNPPYGGRVGGSAKEVREAWAQLDAALSGAFRPWRAGVLCPSAPLAAMMSRPVARSIQLDNGGLPTRLLTFEPA